MNIRYVDLETFRNKLMQTPSKKGTPRKEATVNRCLACLRHMMNKAVSWDMLKLNPFAGGDSLTLKENNQRLRFLSETEIRALLFQCQPYLREIVECALHTGMRKSEMLNLKWSQIRNDHIYLTKTKSKISRQIPINNDLAALFKQIRQRQHLTSEYIFTYQGRRIESVKTAFLAALRRAGIEDFRFHDLRHSFASWFIMRGGDLKSLQEILGHRDIATTMRYSHLSQAHKAQAINLLNGLTGSAKEDGQPLRKTDRQTAMSQNVTKTPFSFVSQQAVSS